MSAWTPIDWWKLEARALYGVPELRRAMAYFAPFQAYRDLAKDVSSRWGFLLTVSNIASFTLPVIAALVVFAPVIRGGVAQVGLGGAMAGIAAVIAAIGFLTDHRDPIGVDPKVGRLLGNLHLLPSAIGSVLAIMWVVQGAANGGIGVIGFIADAIVGALHYWFYRGPDDSGTARWTRNIKRLQLALDTTPPDERARMHSDIQQSLEVLGERGILSDETLVRAVDVPIGRLGMTMAPRDDLKPAKR